MRWSQQATALSKDEGHACQGDNVDSASDGQTEVKHDQLQGNLPHKRTQGEPASAVAKTVEMNLHASDKCLCVAGELSYHTARWLFTLCTI